MTNRLHLNFALTTTEERRAFLTEYLQHEQFVSRPPTDQELETMANYLLWGKDANGKNARQSDGILIETKRNTWNKDADIESLEGLLESPTFSEASLSSLDSQIPMKQPRETFSRKDALAKCPPHLIPTFTELFRQIDRLDLLIALYELEHGKRKTPPRHQLLAKFNEEELCSMRETVSHWNQYKYLRQRHQLVDLRREQYTLRDSYSSRIVTQEGSTGEPIILPDNPQIDCDITVLPLGTKNTSTAALLAFQSWDDLIPANYNEEELRLISNLYWEKQKYQPSGTQRYIDFRELEHVYQMFQQFFELENATYDAELESRLPELMATLTFYVERAELSELQREILDLKLRKVKNVDIAIVINKKWGKTYTPNYISTIFRQRIIPQINEAARYHEKVVSNLFFEEEFKTCTCCGRTLLRDPINFTRKGRSLDGYTARCKRCEKIARNGGII